ncbi:MFS transporter, DHA1 family, purine base/nucleoside efflux pump [Halobacillus alkaliphilus]|uniref:MFS transporter, DHA1 family, purine base/nucleoside efflux pump n=1 Tax=Halobacillus alkaliphilus TaxID=396056 RepID=A0A1I2MHM1_9BACI|nr:MFS transporter [Halobacillus alkaliphilus]SFF90994.1 MFS transporter, DHA1 family, purine base/nucleoside efflux pump [Halobacillus alkaliphilus]
MNKKVYMLAIVAFVVGTVELIIGGTLDLVAADLRISLGQAGLLITIFSLVFALASPILLTATAKIERKQLMLWTLFIFFTGNMIAFWSPSYAILMAARVLTAASGSLLVVLGVTIASAIVENQYRGRAIGIIFMGISGSLVLGVPIGLTIGNAFGWRVPFLLISILTLVSMIVVAFTLERIKPKPVIPIKEQLHSLKDKKIFSAQLTSFLFLTGHLTLYAYLTPFLKTTLGLDPAWVSIAYFIFGVAAVSGGGIGGMAADKWGSEKSIIGIIVLFALAIFIIPYVTFSLPLFLIVMVFWSSLSWAITPAQQNYLVVTAPETSDIQQSLNNSALHLGIALGSTIGGIVIEQSSVIHNATVGGLFVLLALASSCFSITRGSSKTQTIQQY